MGLSGKSISWRKRALLPLLLGALLSGFGPKTLAAPVQVSVAANLADLSSERARKLLEEAGIVPIRADEHPDIAALAPKIRDLVEKLWLPKDGDNPIQIVIADDFSVNARIFRSGKDAAQPRILVLNAGMLGLIENDDQLAFVLGHEMEHETSDLQAWIDGAKTRNNSAGLSLAEKLDLSGRQRAVENEVDVRSLIERVREKGFNPDQARIFSMKMRSLTGDSVGGSHTTWSSRIMTIEAALTALKRGRGDSFDESVVHREIVTAAFHERFAEKSKATRRRKIEKILTDSFDDFDALYARLFSGENLEKVDFRKKIEDEFLDAWGEIYRQAYGLGGEADLLRDKARLLGRLLERRTESRAKIHESDLDRLAPDGMRALGSIESFNGERAFDAGNNNREFGPIKYGSQIKKNRKRIQELRRELESAPDGDAKLRIQSQLHSLENELTEARKHFEAYRALLPAEPETDRAIALAIQHDLAGIPGSNRPGKAWDRRLSKLRLLEKIDPSGKAFSATERWSEAYVRRNVQRIARALASPTQFREDYGYVYIWQLFEHGITPMNQTEREGFQRDFLNHYFREFGVRFPSASPGDQKGFARQAVQIIKSLSLGSYWYADSDYSRAIDTWIGTVARYAPDLETLETVFGGIPTVANAEKRGRSSLINHQETHNRKALVWESESAERYLTKEPGLALFGRRIEFVAKEIASTPAAKGAQFMLEPLDREIDHLLNLATLSKQPESIRNSDAIRRAIDAAIESAVEAIHPKTKRVLDRETLRAWVIYRYQDAFGVKSLPLPQPRVTLREAIAGLKAALEKASDRTLQVLSGLVRSTSLLDLTADTPYLRKQAYNLLTKNLFLLGSPSERLLESKEEIEAFFKSNVEWIDWTWKQRPKDLLRVADELVLRKAFAHSYYEEYKLLSPIVLEANRKYIDQEFRRAIASRAPGRFSSFFRRVYENGFYAARSDIILGHVSQDIRLPLEDAILLAQAADAESRVQPILKGHSDTEQYFKEAALTPEQLDRYGRHMGGRYLPRFEVTAEAIHNSNFSIERKLIGLGALRRYSVPTPERDELILQLRDAAKDDPAALSAMRDPSLVGEFYYNANRRDFALWQLESLHGLAAMKEQVRGSNLAMTHVRPEIEAIAKTVALQFPDAGIMRDGIIDEVEGKIATTEAENARLSALKLDEKTWVAMKEVPFLDAPVVVDRWMKNAYDRLEWAEYLIDRRKEIPGFIDREIESMEPQYRKAEREFIISVKRKFIESGIHARTYVLMPLLDSEQGILAEPKIVDKMTAMILGNEAESPVFRTLFDAYLGSVPEAQKRAILGHVLGGMAEGSKSGRVSMRTVLEAMGPFGIKAGQFLRSSGVVSKEMQEELDGFLDQALEPTRSAIFRDLKRFFGPDLVPIDSVSELLGSGSINYVVRARLRHPKTGEPVEVVIRIQRPAIEGRVANENDIWEKVIEKLSRNSDPKVQNAALLADEARESAFDSLRAGGVELDQSLEREKYQAARAVYTKPAEETASGFRIEPVRPLEDFQSLIPAEYSKVVSVYEYVPSTSWKDLRKSDPNLLGKIAEDVLTTELQAIWASLFDHDGHRGQWPIDVRGNRLVRIDYPLLTRYPKEESAAFQSVMRKIVNPYVSELDASQLTQALRLILDTQGAEIQTSDVAKILAHRNFPKGADFLGRIYFIRTELEGGLRARGLADARVRFRTSARNAIIQLGKLTGYREFMPEATFRKIFMEQIRLSKRDVVFSLMKTNLCRVLLRPFSH